MTETFIAVSVRFRLPDPLTIARDMFDLIFWENSFDDSLPGGSSVPAAKVAPFPSEFRGQLEVLLFSITL